MEARSLVRAEGCDAGRGERLRQRRPLPGLASSVPCLLMPRLPSSFLPNPPSLVTTCTEKHFSDDLSAGLSLHKMNF